jgi:hypothetical protein
MSFNFYINKNNNELLFLSIIKLFEIYKNLNKKEKYLKYFSYLILYYCCIMKDDFEINKLLIKIEKNDLKVKY